MPTRQKVKADRLMAVRMMQLPEKAMALPAAAVAVVRAVRPEKKAAKATHSMTARAARRAVRLPHLRLRLHPGENEPAGQDR